MSMQRIIVAMPDELVEAIDEAAHREERSRSYMIRQAVMHAVSDTCEPQRLEPARAAFAPDVRTLPERHEFAPQGMNALRCRTCGGRKAAH